MKRLVSLLLAVIMVMSVFAIIPVTANAADTNTVYLINSAGWSNVHAYAWNTGASDQNAEWPGQAMQSAGTHSSGAQMYSITFPSAYQNIIFNGGNGGPQTDDLAYQGGMGFDNSSNSWVAVDNPNPNPTPTPGDGATIYFQNNWMWTDVNVYYWFNGGAQNNGTWPGQPAQKFGNDGTYDVYSVTLPAGVEGVIFNGFDGGINALNQTPDIKNFSNGNCYSMVWNGANDVSVQDINNVLPVNPTDPPIPTDPPETQPQPTKAPETKPTQPQPTIVEPTEEEVDGLFVRIDGTKYAVEKGEIYTYQFKVTVPNAKVSGLDALTTYDTDGLDVVPYKLADDTIDDEKHFPVLKSVISNFDIDGEVYYNYSNHKGITLNDAVIFEGQFKVTADKGIFDITTKIKTMADTDMNRIVYDWEKVSEYTQGDSFSAEELPTEPTEKVDEKVYVNVDGTKLEVAQGDIITYEYKLNVPGVKISSFDAQTFYDTKGLDIIPFMDGDTVDDTKHFPSFGSVISNVADIDGEVYYNYSNYKGTSLENKVVFTAQFKVTAASGTYAITTKIKTMADTDMNALVYNFEKKSDFTESSALVDYVAPTTPSKPTEEVKPTQDDKPTTKPSGNLFLDVDGKKFAVEQGQIYTYQYVLNVPGVKISSFDAQTFYQTEGLDLIPYMDGDTVDDTKHFPSFGSVISNVTDIDGEVYYNYSNYKGTSLENKVVFTAQFKVTAAEGTYTITTRIKTMADTSMNALVYNFEKKGDFTEESGLVDYVEPPTSDEPTVVKPTTADKELYLNVDGTKYAVEQGKTYTYEYRMTVPNVKVASFDANTIYDTDGIDVVPFMDGEYIDDAQHFPSFASVISNFDIDGEIYYNFSNHKGITMDDAVIFTAQFKVTAESGTYDITTRIKTLADTAQNRLVYNYEKFSEFTEKSALVDYVAPTKPTEDEKPTETTKETEEVKPTKPAPTQAEYNLFLNVDGTKYPVEQGETYTYEFKLTVPGDGVKISSFDAQTNYDTAGIELVPFMDGEYVDDTKHFPSFKSVISNFDIPGEVYYNYSNYKGVALNDSVIFIAQFKVTASEGTYDITTMIKTMADTKMNALVYNYEKKGDFTAEYRLVDYVQPPLPTVPTEPEPTQPEPTQPEPTQPEPTEPEPTQPQPTQPEPTQPQPTQPQPTQPEPVDELFVKVDGELVPVVKGETYTYTYYLTVPTEVRAIDASTWYDTEGLDVVPALNNYGAEDASKMFPNLPSSLVYNVTGEDGEILYNFSHLAGVDFTNEAVLIKVNFTVTADKGIYDITTQFRTITDTNGDKYVYGSETLKDTWSGRSEFTLYEEEVVEPTDGLYIKIGKTYYTVEQGKEYTFAYYLQVEDKTIDSIDAHIKYDTTGLEYLPILDTDGEDDTKAMFPIIKNPIYNIKNGTIYVNFASAKGVQFPEKTSVLVQCKFKVTASEGIYEITPEMYNLGDETNKDYIVVNGTVRGDYYDKGVILDAEIWPPVEELLIGDVNFDGYINIFDVTAVQCYIASMYDFTDKQKIVADTNFDGYINIFDATQIQLFMAGYISKFE